MSLYHSSLTPEDPRAYPDWAPELLERIVRRIGSAVIGHEEEIRLSLIAMLAGGHVLLEDVPGVGKTMLVRAIAACFGCDVGRIQFTYDLMPADITGTSVYYPHTGEFEFRPGPVMANIVLADEINRASSRAQSALLEAMEEKKVTADGKTYALPAPFFLLATQNPYEFEGTNRLPEAQLDRFLMRLSLGYPAVEHEVRMLSASGSTLEGWGALAAGSEVLSMQRAAATIHVDDSIKQYLVAAAHASRTHKHVSLGISPRGTLAWMRASQAAAFMEGRRYVIPDDCLRVAQPVLAHRIHLRREAKMSGLAQAGVVADLIQSLELPRQRSRKGGRL